MENASKALLMAAGVLIGILIISLAVFLFINFGQRAKNMQEEIQQSQITEFNTRFTKYVADEPIASIYDVISIAKFAEDYNKKNELAGNDQLKVYLEGTRIDENITEKQVEMINKYTDETDMLEQDIETNKVVFSEKALFKCEIPEGDGTRDLSGRILRVNFSQ